MKTIKKTIYLTMIAIAILLTPACSSDDDSSGGGGNAASGTIKAKISGTSFTSSKQLSAANRIDVGGMTTVTVQGNDASGKAIVLVMNGISGPDTYDIGGGANFSFSASYIEVNASNPAATQTWQAPFDSSVAGKITVTEFSATKIVGTFNFTCKNVNGDNSTKEITEGSFNMTF